MSVSQTIPPAGNIGFAILDANDNVVTVSWMPVAQWQSAPPAGAVALLPEQLQMMILSPGRYIFVNGGFSMVPERPDIAIVQTTACTQIDAAAEQCRGQFITTGLGQMLAYQAKAEQAAAFLALYPSDAAATAAAIDPNKWPFLQAEIDITGSDLWNVAAVISGLQTFWMAIASLVEQMRLGTKAAINEATTAAQISGLVAGCIFPTAGVPVQAVIATPSLALTGGMPTISS